MPIFGYMVIFLDMFAFIYRTGIQKVLHASLTQFRTLFDVVFTGTILYSLVALLNSQLRTAADRWQFHRGEKSRKLDFPPSCFLKTRMNIWISSKLLPCGSFQQQGDKSVKASVKRESLGHNEEKKKKTLEAGGGCACRLQKRRELDKRTAAHETLMEHFKT